MQESGPLTAAALAERLALSPAAVRRHLDALVADGSSAEVAAPRSPPSRAAGAARPVPTRSPTPAAASSATPTTTWPPPRCATCATPAASRRWSPSPSTGPATLADRIGARRTECASSRATRPALVAEALTDEGYARQRDVAAPAGQGIQICQHHCPVAHVAAEFPELCEAETRAFDRGARYLRPAAGHHRPRRRRLHHPRPRPVRQLGRRSKTTRSTEGMTNDHRAERILTQDEQIDALADYKFGWADTDVAGASARARACPRRSCATSRR